MIFTTVYIYIYIFLLFPSSNSRIDSSTALGWLFETGFDWYSELACRAQSTSKINAQFFQHISNAGAWATDPHYCDLMISKKTQWYITMINHHEQEDATILINNHQQQSTTIAYIYIYIYIYCLSFYHCYCYYCCCYNYVYMVNRALPMSCSILRWRRILRPLDWESLDQALSRRTRRGTRRCVCFKTQMTRENEPCHCLNRKQTII